MRRGPGDSFQEVSLWVGEPTERNLSRGKAIKRGLKQRHLPQRTYKLSNYRQHIRTVYPCVLRFPPLVGIYLQFSWRRDTPKKRTGKARNPSSVFAEGLIASQMLAHGKLLRSGRGWAWRKPEGGDLRLYFHQFKAAVLEAPCEPQGFRGQQNRCISRLLGTYNLVDYWGSPRESQGTSFY